MKRNRLFSVALAAVMCAGFLLCSVPAFAADTPTTPPTYDETQTKARFDTLRALLEGKYFTTNQCSAGDFDDRCEVYNVVRCSWLTDLLGPDYPSINPSYMPDQYYTESNGTVINGRNGGCSCWGFANFACYYIYSSKSTDKLTSEVIYSGEATMAALTQYARCGDIIRFGNGSSGHSQIFYSLTSDGMYALDSNWVDDCMVGFGVRTLAGESRNGSRKMTITRPVNHSESEGTNKPPVEGAIASRIVASSNGVNLREAPNTDCKVLTALADNTIFYVFETSADQAWVKTVYQNQTGWICAQYTRLVHEYTSEENPTESEIIDLPTETETQEHEEETSSALKDTTGLLTLAASSRAMVRNGSSGRDVLALQKALNALNYNCGTADGIFGNNTRNAVLGFQRAYKLDADAIFGPKSWSMLYSLFSENGREQPSEPPAEQQQQQPQETPETNTEYTKYPMVRYGNSNTYVRTLQSRLNALGYDCGAADGIYGNNTYKAVTAFQRAKSLDVDGIVGPLTWKALYI